MNPSPLSTRNARAHTLISAIVGLAALGVCAMTFTRFARPAPKLLTNVRTVEAGRGDVLVTVTEEGNVESASNLDVRCRVAGGSSILWIVEDGSQVKKGDKLVELDSSGLDDQISTQRIAYEQAQTVKLQSEKALAVAKIAVKEYLEGTFRQALQDAESLIVIASENLRTAEHSLKQSKKMFRQGYISSLDLEAAQFAVQRCELELGSAETAREVLMSFTKEKTLEELRSVRDNAEAQLKADIASFELEQTRLNRLEDQLSACTMYAPQDGMVVYANEQNRRSAEVSIEEGAALREQQVILRLPDLKQMQVNVTVHESKIDQVEIGMRSRIRILNRETTGVVTTLANQPEPSSPFEGNVKEYAAKVRIDEDDSASLRPGMTAEVEILIAHASDVITLPLECIVEKNGAYLAWVISDGVPEQRPLLIGHHNDQLVEIKDGVSAGERVAVDPRSSIPEARSRPAVAGDDAANWRVATTES